MFAPNHAHNKLLKEYPRAIVHMRAQLKLQRFSLIFGAGFNKTFGLPDWPGLINAIASDPLVAGKDILARITGRGSLPYKTELLFQHFRKQQADKVDQATLGSSDFENRTSAAFLKICASHLYATAPTNVTDALENHGYILNYLPIIRETPITITYNFDDYIEQALFLKKPQADNTLGYETVTNPWSQFRRRKAVIYHPHGVLLKELMECPNDRIVFSESSYAQLYLGALAGDFSFLLNHMSKNTCLIVGSSLEDEDLRNVLVQGSRSHPGNPHYYVQFVGPGDAITPADMEAIKRANFHVYNLITLFLTQGEIAALADLLDQSCLTDAEFVDRVAEMDGCGNYRFYLTGALGVGKSTTTFQLGNLMVLDEWAEPREPLLAKPWDTLTDQEKTTVDSWIARQFRIKNDKLRHELVSICLVDRPPMDPLAFTPEAERPAKAKLLLDKICAGGRWKIAEGCVILLTGEPNELSARVSSSGRSDYTPERVRKMAEDLKGLYCGDGVRVIDTRGRTVAEVTKAVSEIIHLEEYKPFKFTERLEAIKPLHK